MNQPLRTYRTCKGIRLGLACCGTILLMMLAACGQKGPLFLPEDTESEPATIEQAVGDGQNSGEEDENGEGAGR